MLCVSDYCIRLISSVPTGRNLEPSVPAAVQENAVRRSLTRYILHSSVVSEQILKWSNISFSPGDGGVTSRGSWSLTGHPLHFPDDLASRHIGYADIPAYSGVPRGGVGGLNPPPRNSEGPPKPRQTQPDCENC